MILELLQILVLILVVFFIIFMFKQVFSRDKCSEKLAEMESKLREVEKQCSEKLKAEREHYETLLKDAAIKNSIMVSLYKAWKNSELRECYARGGELRILADGTLLCSLEKIEESYVIKVEEKKPEEAIVEVEKKKRGKKTGSTGESSA